MVRNLENWESSKDPSGTLLRLALALFCAFFVLGNTRAASRLDELISSTAINSPKSQFDPSDQDQPADEKLHKDHHKQRGHNNGNANSKNEDDATTRQEQLAAVDRRAEQAVDDFEKAIRRNAASLKKNSPKIKEKQTARARAAQKDNVKGRASESFGGKGIKGNQKVEEKHADKFSFIGKDTITLKGKMPTFEGIAIMNMEDTVALKKLYEKLAKLEQERREIIVRYPQDGDQEFTRQRGKLLTEEEIRLLKVLEEGAPTAREKADQIVKALEANGVVRGLAYAGTYENPQIKDVLAIKYYSLVNEGKEVKKFSAFALTNKVKEKDWQLMNFLTGSPPSCYRLIKDEPKAAEPKTPAKPEA